MEPVRFGVISTAKIGIDEGDPGDAEVAALPYRGDRLARSRRASAAAEALGIPQGLRLLRRAARRPGDRGGLQPAAQPPARAAGRSRRPPPASTCCARSRSRCRREEAAKLIAARDRAGVLIQEAFMVRYHPQWLRARELVRAGRIGELRVVQGSFGYFNVDPANVRNQADIGGGGLLDIGVLPDRRGALPVRGRADAGGGADRARSGLQDRPPEPARCCDFRPARRCSSARPSSCPTSACRSSAARAGSRSRSPSTRRPTGRAGSSSTTAASSATPRPRGDLRGDRPVHAAGRRLRPRDP